jgi:outer membrane receptor for ferric coprogen and ferric-rhodotorulic acid
MDDFRLDNASKVLAQTTGVTVEAVETDRTYYGARLRHHQFPVRQRGHSFRLRQRDGRPRYGAVRARRRRARRERPDFLHRQSIGHRQFRAQAPDRRLAASASVTAGSWNTRRLDADVSTPLSADGKVAARFVVAHEEGDSYGPLFAAQGRRLRRRRGKTDAGHHPDRGPQLPGQRGRGMWGALPVAYADGTPADYPISTSTSADWSRWSIINNSTFAELAHQFNADWRVTATATDNRSASDSKLFYVYGTPDKATGDGLFSYPSRYASANKQRLLDVGATGAFTLAGRRHDLSMGLAWSKSTLDDVSYYGRGIAAALPNMARRSTAPIRNRCLTHRPMAAPTRTNARTPAGRRFNWP